MRELFNKLFRRRRAEVILSDALLARMNEMVAPLLEKMQAAVDSHTAEAARHAEAAEHYRVLVNAGVVKAKSRHEAWRSRN